LFQFPLALSKKSLIGRQQLVEEPVRGQVLLDRVAHLLRQQLGGVHEPKLLERGARAVEIDPALRGVRGGRHRATSARAA
jgi:hypothetical protein